MEHTDLRRGVVRALNALERVGGPRRLLPWLLEKLELAAAEALAKPALGGVVEDGEAVEEGDAELGERVGVFWDARVVDAGGGEEGKGEGEKGGVAHCVCERGN